MSKIKAINSKITDVKVAIEATLSIGGDTERLRNTLKVFEAELVEAECEAADAERTHRQALAEQADQRAAQSVQAAHQSLVTAAGPAEVAGVKLPEPQLDPAVADAAARLGAARERLEREKAVHAGHLEDVARLQGRLNAKEAARTAIINRRATGEERPTDPNEIHLLAEDISTLKGIVSRARATAEQHRPNTAVRLITEAESALAHAQSRAVFEAKLARVRELEQAFLTAHAELLNAGAAVGQRNQFTIFRASDALRRITYGA